MGTVHELKIYPQYFEEVLNGNKTFEVRKNDRGFQVGDIVILKEFDNIRYSGREVKAEITYILNDSFYGVATGFVVLAIKVIDYNC